MVTEEHPETEELPQLAAFPHDDNGDFHLPAQWHPVLFELRVRSEDFNGTNDWSVSFNEYVWFTSSEAEAHAVAREATRCTGLDELHRLFRGIVNTNSMWRTLWAHLQLHWEDTTWWPCPLDHDCPDCTPEMQTKSLMRAKSGFW